MKELFVLLRPRHWVKNAFVLVPLFLSFRFTEMDSFLLAMYGVAVFCLAASAVYVGNDIVDRKKDRLHETKKNRPIAAGTISIPSALVLLIVLTATSLLMAVSVSWIATAIALGYLILNSAYSLGLKNVAIIDVFIIAAGFVLRVWMGAEVIGVAVSQWTVLITVFLSLFLGFGKRRNEIAAVLPGKHRSVLDQYTSELLTIYMIISAVLTINAYTFFTIDDQISFRFASHVLLYSVPVVVFGLFRYMLLVIGRGKGGDVAELVTQDVPIVLSVFAWMAIVIGAYQW